MDRRALVVGSWLAHGRNKPSPQRVRSITDRWNKIFTEDRYGFRSLAGTEIMPTPLHNPTVVDLIGQLEGARRVTNNTELLFYFVGHSVSAGENDIDLILGVDEDGENRSCSLTWFIASIYQHTRIRRLVVVLDTCHAGRTREAFRLERENSFAMFGTGDAYAFDANFSDGLLRALEQPIRKNDQRIDRRASGLTYQKIFEEARRRLISGPVDPGRGQNPKCFGDYGGQVLLKAPASIPEGFNDFVSSRSIYGRAFRLLELIQRNNPTLDALREAIRRDPVFLLRREDDGRNRFVSNERLSEYIDFLRTAKWIVQPRGRFELTEAGRASCDRARFNRALLAAIEHEVLSEDINFEFLEEVVKELLSDMIPPTPIRMKERAGMKGKLLRLDSATRVAIQLLPSTGQFMKGAADAIYPSELGG